LLPNCSPAASGTRGAGSQLPVRLRALGAQRIFHEERPGVFELAAQQHRVRRVEPGVHIDDELHVVAHRVPCGLEPFQRHPDRLPRFHYWGVRCGHGEAQVAPALGDEVFAGGNEDIERSVLTRDVRIAGHPLAHLAAEQSVHRNTQRLSLHVPERHIHRGDRRTEEPVGREETRPAHQLPQVLNAGGVLADQDIRQVGHCAADRFLTGPDADLAQPGHAGVGVHQHQHHAVPAIGDGQDLHAGDPHAGA
jgi:hypothetical protein